MTQMQAVGDYELQLCVLLTGVNSGGLPALVEWDFLLLCWKAGKWQELLSDFFRMFRIPPELWVTHCWEPRLVSWQIIGVTVDTVDSLEDCGQEGGGVQKRHPNSFVWHFCLLSIAGSSFDPSHLLGPKPQLLGPLEVQIQQASNSRAASLFKVLNVFFSFKSISKETAAKNGDSWKNHQCSKCNFCHSDVFKWHSQNKFLSKVFNHHFHNIWLFRYLLLKILAFFQMLSCNDRLILLFAGCIHPDFSSTGKIYSLVIIMK